jgi:hypothetical protein
MIIRVYDDDKPEAVITKKDLSGGQLRIRCRLEGICQIFQGKTLALDIEKGMSNFTDFTIVSNRVDIFSLQSRIAKRNTSCRVMCF